MRAIIRRLRKDRRGVSNVIVVMLSLVLVVIIVSNVVLWSYQMNQLDWERVQEKVRIVDVSSITYSSWLVAQSEYAVNIGSHTGGTYSDTHVPDGEYETFAEATPGMYWLSNWSKRIKITINQSDVNETLVDFPVLIYLSNSSGRTGANVSCVFKELQSRDNNKKVAVTTSDGETQCYVEIERWENINQRAWLWVKVPSISSSQDTILYLYYDRYQADNAGYVGNTGSETAEKVWGNNFELVHHLGEMLGSQQDSTSNNNDGTPQGGVIQDAGGKIDGANAFDGTDDRILIDDSPSLSFTVNQLTMEAWVKLDFLPTQETVIARKDNQWQIGFIDSNSIRNLVRTNGINGWTVANDENYSFQTETWYYWTFVYDGTKIVHRINAAQVGSAHSVTGNVVDNSSPVHIGYCIYTNEFLNGTIDEVRVSSAARSAAWIKTTFESERDDLVAYGSEQVLGEEQNEFDITGALLLDLSSYPLSYVQTVEIQLRYRASDTGETFYLRTYNWTGKEYSDYGFNSTVGHTPTGGWDTYAVNLTDKWSSYVSEDGQMYMKLQDSQPDANRTFIDIDFFAIRIAGKAKEFTFQNEGALTVHIVSLWICNSTHHQRYDTDIFINSGDSTLYIRSDIPLPDKPYIVKAVSERGNIAVFAGS